MIEGKKKCWCKNNIEINDNNNNNKKINDDNN